jgi:hypothetical protein
MKPNPNERGDKPQREDQQPSSDKPQQQQQDAGGGAGQQYGEGNYQATRDYERGLKEHMKSHDIEREARDAAPRSDAEKKEMDEAESVGRSRAKGRDDDMPEDPGEPVK